MAFVKGDRGRVAVGSSLTARTASPQHSFPHLAVIIAIHGTLEVQILQSHAQNVGVQTDLAVPSYLLVAPITWALFQGLV